MKKALFALGILSMLILLQNCFSSSSKKIKLDINNEAQIKEYLQGKWEWVKYGSSVNSNNRYRFQIEGDQLKIWYCIGNTDDPFDMSESPKVHPFKLGAPTRTVDGYRCRYLEFDEGNVSLDYRAVSPILIILDYDYYDKPEIRCAAGVSSWDRTQF